MMSDYGRAMRTVKEIIEDAGGPKRIAEASKRTSTPIVAKSVYDWPQIGIPEKHWPIIIRLAKSSADELYKANLVVRDRPKSDPERVAYA